MGKTLVSFLALYLLITGWKGNARNVVVQAGKDAPGFIPWILAILMLGLLDMTKARPVVRPFIVLALITMTLQKFPTIQKSIGDTINEFN